MKKSTLIYLVIFLLVGVAAAYFWLSRSNSTIAKSEQDFAIEDTSEVYKIILTDKQGNKSELERKSGNTWMVNNSVKAQKSLVDMLLETMKLVQVKQPVSMAARDNVIKIMATDAVKVQAFDDDGDLIKSYYVGGTTPDELGTLMLLEDADDPFVTHIPGFWGYLNSRYVTKPQEWRTTEIYALNPSTIQEVSVKYNFAPDASFKMVVNGPNDFILHDLEGKKPQQKVSDLNAKRLLAGFRNIGYEQFPKLKPHELDSIANSNVFVEVNVKAEGSNPPSLKLFLKKADERTKGVGPGDIDLDKYYAIIGDNKKEVVLVQTEVLEKILATYDALAPRQ